MRLGGAGGSLTSNQKALLLLQPAEDPLKYIFSRTRVAGVGPQTQMQTHTALVPISWLESDANFLPAALTAPYQGHFLSRLYICVYWRG